MLNIKKIYIESSNYHRSEQMIHSIQAGIIKSVSYQWFFAKTVINQGIYFSILKILWYNNGMILMKLASILLLVLTLALAIILSRLFKLKKRGSNAADLAFPFLIFEYYLITAKMFTHNQLPVLGIALSILAIVLVFFFLNKRRSFYYPKFIKFFWRAGFLLTLLIYIIMIVQIFMMK